MGANPESMKNFLPIGLFLGAIPALLLGGCASYSDLPPGTVREVISPVIEQQEVSVPALPQTPPPSVEYRIGPGDVLYVNVAGREDLSSPGLRLFSAGKVQGSRVDGSGDVHLPLVGTVRVAGLTVVQAEEKLRRVFAPYLQEPWIVVEVAEYRSHPLHLLGQFNQPGTYYMERPLSLLEGIALGSGLNDTANLRGARLIREGKTAPVDLFRLLQEGAPEQNVWLSSGDIIFVPDDKNQNVFVFGAVKKPGAVPMPNGRLNLAQALANAGIDGAGDNEEHIRIIRSLSPTKGELIVVDLRQILKGRNLPFPLMEGDIVYVPFSAVGNWNQAISEILPTLQAVSSVLQPFVQIKFLSESN